MRITRKLCLWRDVCMVKVRCGVIPRSEMPSPCGFEMAGYLSNCPKMRRFAVSHPRSEEEEEKS